MKYCRWIFLILFISTFSPVSSWAYLSLGGSAEIPKEGSYLLGIQPQVLINEGGGFILGGFLETPYNDDLAFRYNAGFGKIDFHFGAGFKWVPVPDVDRQPAIGVKVSAWHARQKDTNYWIFQLAPMFSKKFETKAGLFIPFAGIPINLVKTTDSSYTGTQFTMGSELHHRNIEGMFFSLEADINLKDSYSFITGTINFPFDGDKGFSRGK